jgi:hypothetical protein
VVGVVADAFLYAYPMLFNYKTLYQHVIDSTSPAYVGGFGRFRHYQRVYTPADSDIVTPNNDTPYSWAWLDLRAEPWVLSTPAAPGDRYTPVGLTMGRGWEDGRGCRRVDEYLSLVRSPSRARYRAEAAGRAGVIGRVDGCRALIRRRPRAGSSSPCGGGRESGRQECLSRSGSSPAPCVAADR